MNNCWTLTKLSELLRPVLRPERVDPMKEYRLLGVRLNGAGPFHRETIQGSQSAATTLYKVKSGDFIYSRLFASRGAFGVITSELDGCHVSGEFPTFAADPDNVDINFLKLWFRLPTTIRKVDSECSGSTPLTRNRFKENFFLNLEIPLPPFEEQRRIVTKIDQLAAKIKEIDALHQQVAEEMEAFVNSVHIKLAGNRKRKLGEILTLDEDEVIIKPTEDYPQVGVKSFGVGLFAKSAISGTETTYRTFNRLYEGAVVLSQVKGWEGAVDVCGSELSGWFVSPEYRTFRCIPEEALPGYLAALVRTKWFWGRLKEATRGVGARRERTRPEQFLAIEIAMPDVQRQRFGETLFAEVDVLRQLQADTSAQLDALIPSILDKAFKGQL